LPWTQQVRKHWRDWRFWKERYRDQILVHILRNHGVRVLDEDWNNLVILDACRYDVFQELNTIPGVLERRISRGSNTREFLVENFKKHTACSRLDNIVYVAGNPFVTMLLSEGPYKIYPVWDYGWDDSIRTVPPSVIVRETLEARAKNPDKRMIAHFMQPHEPFLSLGLDNDSGFSGLRNSVLEGRGEWEGGEVWDLMEKGKLDREEVLKAYRNNLKLVLPFVQQLVNALSGKSVVTSDHGQLFGERPHVLYPFRVYGHRNALHVRGLVEIPWLIVDAGR
jgi:hypothetical protein